MAASFVIATATQNDIANKMNDDLDGGKLQIYSGASPGPNSAATGTKLAELTLPAKASNSVNNGVLTFGAITQQNALASGTAGYFRLTKADGTTVVADGDVSTSGASLNLNTTAIVSGGPVNITAFSITAPAGT
jgi:hypothetical protein